MRVASEDMKAGGLEITKGTTVHICPLVIHYKKEFLKTRLSSNLKGGWKTKAYHLTRTFHLVQVREVVWGNIWLR